jgi:hypothetical protein
MTARIRKIAMALAALAALAFGGAQIAQGAGSTPASPPSKAETTTPGDTDNVQSGDQSTPDAADKPDAAGEKPDAAEAPGSEQPGDDGPGGHADEPSNPNANNQATGAQ